MRGLWQLALIAAIVLAIPAFFFGPAYLRHRQEARVRADGLPATARILRLEDTGSRRNSMPIVDIHLEVTAEGRPPWQASIRRVMSVIEVTTVGPGTVLQVRYDPARPELVAIAP
ncbi:DUF3592 domain-containing protein [Roseomonas fluvialis]|uniref:DUF3592 domain-containing protein n=1 Tax=Roseomonas fluvialis TaxID=1750527 RepID=A0ABN6P408_9PROT|nr:DUF3592 domain-containing protein [Roseomonas fluvialis]BDG72349.1 hypothetical protein Rmf_22780 [Roseomonas fluvialis]